MVVQSSGTPASVLPTHPSNQPCHGHFHLFPVLPSLWPTHSLLIFCPGCSSSDAQGWGGNCTSVASNFCCWVALPVWAQRAAAMAARLGTELLRPLVISSSGRLSRSSKMMCTPNLEGEALSPGGSGYSGSGEPEPLPRSPHRENTHTHSYTHLPMHTLSNSHTPHTRPVAILQSSLQKHLLVVLLILCIH